MLLNCHTYYSFGYGTLSPENLFTEAKTNGYTQLVLSDINNTSAILDSLRQSKDFGLKIIPGIDFRNGVEQLYIGIAQNNEGFKELNTHLTYHLHHNIPFDKQAPSFNHVFVVYPLSNYKGQILKENEFIGVSIKDLASLPFSSAKHHYHKLVVLQTATFIEKKHFNAHRLLRAIDRNTLLSKLPAKEQADANDIIYNRTRIESAFSSYPKAIQNTAHILNSCSVEFEFGKMSNKNLKHYTNSVQTDIELLRSESLKGLNYRYSNPKPEILERVEKELRIIEKMNFASYFLINWDIIKYAQHKNYYYVGRGSGANSMIAYLLRITDVDPIELDLYFERFINENRSNPPDFDIDFSWTDRDDMTRYIFEKFGHDRTALLATYATFKDDAVIRELGKVFGLPPTEIEQLQYLKERKLYPEDNFGQLIFKYSSFIKNYPSHLSIHASGILISEEPIMAYSATFMPPKGYATTQFSMQEAEDIGLAKFDILSQRGLGKIKDSLELIKLNTGTEIDIHNVKKFYEDEKVKDLLRIGKCIGCFYVESPAMRMLLAKLQADDYLRLVAASSIIRPGVAKSGMMREYILRYRDKARRKKAEDELPVFYNLLKETFGVMVYQEDVIKVAHLYAGLSLAEADYLRRGMSWKFKQRNEFHEVERKFFDNCKAKGYDEKITKDIWIQIESFANFAFSKGHSASYAVESFQALFLKAYFPLEYMVATLNNGGGFYRVDLYLHEARMHGATIMPPCINKSELLCSIEGSTIYLGFVMIGELETHTSEIILLERKRNGLYKNLYDFIKRTSLSLDQIRQLIRIGAFNFTGKNKKELLWEAHSFINPVKKKTHETELFDVKPKKYKLPPLFTSWIDDAFDEMEILGFTLTSPFKLLRHPEEIRPLTATQLKQHIGKVVEITGYLVTQKNTKTSKGDYMHFGTFIDIEGLWIDTVHFPPVAKAFPFKGKGCYLIKGKVTEEFDFLTIEVQELHHMPMLNRDDVVTNEAENLMPDEKQNIIYT